MKKHVKTVTSCMLFCCYCFDTGFLRLNSRYRKNGAPTPAVNTPAGISSGMNNMRPARSAASKMIAPSSAEAGMTSLYDVPTNLLAMCGARRPMNDSVPAIAMNGTQVMLAPAKSIIKPTTATEAPPCR